MKGDFSRDTFNPDRHYTAVLMQQGRVQLDADWNEQQAINQHRDETEAADVIGACGAPKNNAGFAITTDGDGKMLFIGTGRYYVDGILCENATDKLAYDDQAKGDLPSASIAQVLEELKKQNTSLGLVYLDVWKRHVTFLEDGLLLEKALGEPDTTTRVQTVWQVRVLPVSTGGAQDKLNELTAKRGELQAQIQQTDEALAALNQEIEAVKAKIDSLPTSAHERAELTQLLKQLNSQATDVKKASDTAKADLQVVEAEIAKLSDAAGPDCGDTFKEWDSLPTLSSGKLNARTQTPANQNDPCLPPPTAGYRRLENQLYRVEVHDPGALGTATFKWSRDNGTVVTAIEKISGNTITVHDLGRDEVLGFKAGDWVEITDDALELNGLPGQLAQINPPNEATKEITLLNATPTPLANNLDGVDKSRHPKLRRWDQVNAQAAPADEHGVNTSASFVLLEDGIEVQFSAGTYRTGDYWLIPARTATGEIEWPPYAIPNINPIAQPARGIEHHYCRLALVQVDDGVVKVSDDCRTIFCPLTEVQCEETALHVAATNWVNDDIFPLGAGGSLEFRITLDDAPDPQSVNDASVIVTVEFPFRTEGQNPTPGLYQTIIIEGKVGIDPADKQVIVWRYDPPTPNPDRDVLRMLADVAEPVAEPAPRRRRGKKGRPRDAPGALAAINRPQNLPRLNVTLKGSIIWRNAPTATRTQPQRRYLDGQAFGQPALRADNQAPRTALIFPTGAGAKASDFESWLYIGPARQPTLLRVTTVTFMRVTGQPSSAGTVTMPVPVGTQVKFKAGEQVRFADITFNRAIVKVEQQDMQKPQSVVVEKIPSAVAPKVLGVVSTIGESVVRFEARNPEIFTQGTYRLTVLGDDGDASSIKAEDNKSNLDGDFNNQVGGNFVLQFEAE